MVNYIHHVPGRLRVNTPVLKRNEFRARQLKSYLEGMHGVLRADTSIVTGSVVIKYDTDMVSSAVILNSLHDLGYIQNIHVSEQAAQAAPQMQKAADIFMAKLVETALEKSAVALIAALI
jgi:copper chaperone CopZ